MKKLLALLILLYSTSVISANPLARVYSANDPVYRKLEIISLESGMLPPPSASPWSGYELFSHLQKINETKLSPTGKRIYQDLVEQLVYSDEFSGFLNISPEIYLNLNPDGLTYRDWFYDASHRMPMVNVYADAVLGDNFFGVFDYEMKKNLRFMYPSEGKNLGFANVADNIVREDRENEDSIPHKAFAGISSENLSFVIGRDTVSWGRGSSGSLFIGDHAPFHDFMYLAAYQDRINYRFIAMQMDKINHTTGKQETFTLQDSIRFFTAHRLEYNVTPRFRVAVTEGALFLSNHLDIRMFSPMMFLHNYQLVGEAKSLLQLEFEAVVYPGWLGYLHVLIDQIQTPGEVAAYPEEKLDPNALGLLGGVSVTRSALNGFVTGVFESVLTTPFLYMRQRGADGKDLDLDIVNSVNLRRNKGISWLGYKYGPDTFALAFNVSYEDFDGLRVYSDAVFGIQGEYGLLFDGKKQYLVTGEQYLYRFWPIGDPLEYFLLTGVGAEYQLKSLPIKLNSHINSTFRWNAGNEKGNNLFDLQLVLGAELKLNAW